LRASKLKMGYMTLTTPRLSSYLRAKFDDSCLNHFRDIIGAPKLPILCQLRCKTTTQSISTNSLYFLNLSPINAKLTSLSYVSASKYICFSAIVHRYYSNNTHGTCVSVILLVNRLTSTFLFTLVCE